MVDFVKSLLSDLDPGALLPDLNQIFGGMELLLRLLVMAGPLCLLGLGLWYLLAPPPEANHIFGYRFFWGMSSVDAWRFTQKVAGITWTLVGLVMTVAMAIGCNGYRDMGWEEMLWSAIRSIVWELGSVVVSVLVINLVVFVCFDRKGYQRKFLTK